MENQKNKKVFRSRVSVLLIGFVLAILIPITIPIIKSMVMSSLCIVGGTFLFTVLLSAGMRYIISDNKLYVKICNITIANVDISNIISVERSYNLLSSPAASLKRLRLGLRKGTICSFILISPIREVEFIEELKAVNSDINVNVPVKNGVWRIQDWDI